MSTPLKNIVVYAKYIKRLPDLEMKEGLLIKLVFQ
jgi:hypothetical protein